MNGSEAAESSDEESDFVVYDDDDETEDFSQDVPASAANEEEEAAEQLGPAAAFADIQSQKKRSRKRARNFDTIRTSKAYTKSQLTELELVEEIAENCDLNPHGLNDHEHGLLDDDINEELYFKVSAAPLKYIMHAIRQL